MDVLRGRASTPEADRDVTADALARAADEGATTVRVRPPHRQVAFGRRDANREGYADARRAASDRGYRAIERRVGGRAVAYTGRTLAFAVALPIDDAREGIDARYGTATAIVRAALDDCGATVVAGEPAASFCPGAHSLRVRGGGKVAGIAQRVRRGAALVAGCLVVAAADEADVPTVLDPVYRALGVEFDPRTVGSVAAAGGPDDPEAVAKRLETAFVDGPWGDGSKRVERVGPDPW